MNLADLRNELWNYTSFQEAGSQEDWLRQKIDDVLNLSLQKVATVCPDQVMLHRESVLNLVPNVGMYPLSDWCTRGASFYRNNVSAGEVRFHRPRTVDRNGLRSPALAPSQLGPYHMTAGPETTSAYRSGASGAATGASAASGATTVTINGSPGFDGSEVGRMLKLNGEYIDYMVLGVSGNVVTVDRPIYTRIRVSGSMLNLIGTVGVGPAYTNVRWEIGPKLCCQVLFLPPPTAGLALPYRFLAMPRMLCNPDDEPEIRSAYHELLWKGGIKELGVFDENLDMWQAMSKEFDDAMARWTNEDMEHQPSGDEVASEFPTERAWENNLLPGVYRRDL